jgi:hypothetical protein
MTISGMADCLDALSSQKSEINYDYSYAAIKKLIF